MSRTASLRMISGSSKTSRFPVNQRLEITPRPNKGVCHCRQSPFAPARIGKPARERAIRLASTAGTRFAAAKPPLARLLPTVRLSLSALRFASQSVRFLPVVPPTTGPSRYSLDSIRIGEGLLFRSGGRAGGTRRASPRVCIITLFEGIVNDSCFGFLQAYLQRAYFRLPKPFFLLYVALRSSSAAPFPAWKNIFSYPFRAGYACKGGNSRKFGLQWPDYRQFGKGSETGLLLIRPSIVPARTACKR